MNQPTRITNVHVKREPHSPEYSKPFPIPAPAACMVHTDRVDGGEQEKLIQFSSTDDRKWLSKHAFWCMCEGHRLITYIISGDDLTAAIAAGVPRSEQLESFMSRQRNS